MAEKREKPPITSKMETDYVKDRTETEYVGNGKVKSGLLLQFIRPMFWGLVRGAGGSVPRVCEVEGRLCKWTHTKSNSQNMAPASLYRRSRTTKP